MYKKIKNRTYELLTVAESEDKISKLIDIAIITLISLNTITVIIDTFELSDQIRSFLDRFEIFSVTVFTIEYFLRLWTADLLYPNKTALKARLRYIVSFMALIDLSAILPFYIPYIIPIDLRALRTFRIIRIFRLFKVNRYTDSLATIVSVIKAKAHQLISSMFVVSIMIIIASIIMYNVEHEAQPEVFTNAFSGIWWAIATLTTVGYGDIFPITAVGKIISAVIALLGIGLVAVPTGIISAGFMEHISEEENDEKDFCPFCGKKIK